MSDSLQVDPDALRDLAGRAVTIGGDIAALGAGLPELGGDASGSPAVSSAMADFAAAMADRLAALQVEMEDAAEFLQTFADTIAGVDQAGGGR